MGFDMIDRGIFRILIPFQDLTTTVYLYVSEEGTSIIDSGTYPSDVDQYIMPVLERLHISHEDVKYFLLTHHHGDHAGGIQRLTEIFPHAVLGTSFSIDLPNRVALTDNERILGALYAICLPGHTENSFGFFDALSGTLLSGDCLQLDGVGKYRNGILNYDRYVQSVNKLKSMNICRIVAAHAYDPLGSVAEGKTAVAEYLDKCIEIAKRKNG